MGLCVGLFGTCGGSQWRAKFIQTYTTSGIKFYNPQVDNWTPDCAQEEAEHLASDDIILFPVTDETPGLGSLAETGYSIIQAIKANSNREFVIMIDSHTSERCRNNWGNELSIASDKARALVKAHLKKICLPNLYVVDTLDQMLYASIRLYDICKLRQELRGVLTGDIMYGNNQGEVPR